MSDPPFSAGWIAASFSTMLAVMASAVAALFKINEGKSTRAVESLELRLAAYQNRLEETEKMYEARLTASEKKHEAHDLEIKKCLEDRIRLAEQAAADRIELISELNHLKGIMTHYVKKDGAN